MEELFVCEKPSVARDMANAISGGYESKSGYYVGKDGKVYTNAFGHLVSCIMPEEINEDWGWKGNVSSLPFFIKDIPLKVKEGKGIKNQFKLIVDLMKKAEVVYIATDAGREGEHIFRKIYAVSGVEKPLKRLWMQDMTTEGIIKAYKNAKDATLYDGLALAGKLREESDLMIGLNATMLLTKLSGNNKTLSMGRVQTPTLAMIVNRDKKIEEFKKVVHYTLVAASQSGHNFELETEKDEFMTKEDADIVLNQLGERINYQVFTKEKKEKPKKLFDLTTLQRHMNTKYKWSASKTLEVTQSLYEKQLVTYPRTNSQFLANDSELPDLLKAHKDSKLVSKIINNGYTIDSSFIDSSKVTDHEAIIITKKTASDLMKDQEALYNEIFHRFVAAFYPPAIKKEVIATFNDGQYTFKAKETFLIELGWRELFEGSLEKGTLEACVLDDIGDYKIIEKETKPPKRYTEATLLSDMENAGKYLIDEDEKKLLKSVAGIGTVATRADIIETLINRGFVEKKSNNLLSTTLGREIIGMMPEDFALYSVKLTAFFESMLAEIEKGDLDEQSFYEELKGLIQRTSKEMRKHIKKVSTPTKEVIAPCPNCGNDMYENSKAYYCSGYKDGCMTSLWKNGLQKLGKNKITKNEAQKLLNGKKINVRLKSKAGKAYKKDVVFDKEKGWVVFADKK